MSEWVFSTIADPGDIILRNAYFLTQLWRAQSSTIWNNRMRLFIENFEDCMQDSDYLLHQIRLLILSVVQNRHIYMVAVDIKDPDFVVIDISNFVQEISARYGQLPALLKRYLVDYLRSVGHPIADALSVIGIHRLEMQWRTANNHSD
ncbi:hypothetical protein L1887_17523 [Cichorium endivia]|nr:hypothetical protein L1887_17523 [Cichorium endivia]